MAKREVQAWIGFLDGRPDIDCVVWSSLRANAIVTRETTVYHRKKDARLRYEDVRRCTITYDDGKPEQEPDA